MNIYELLVKERLTTNEKVLLYDELRKVFNMKIDGLFLNERLTEDEKSILYDQCRGCLNRICVTDDKEEVLTLLASLQLKAMILGKNTFMRIDEKQ